MPDSGQNLGGTSPVHHLMQQLRRFEACVPPPISTARFTLDLWSWTLRDQRVSFESLLSDGLPSCAGFFFVNAEYGHLAPSSTVGIACSCTAPSLHPQPARTGPETLPRVRHQSCSGPSRSRLAIGQPQINCQASQAKPNHPNHCSKPGTPPCPTQLKLSAQDQHSSDHSSTMPCVTAQ